jgi:hypothetical protein
LSFITIILFALTATIFQLCNGCSAQQKPAFKKLTYINYRANDSLHSTHVIVEILIEISADGRLVLKMNGYNDINYENQDKDTTYKISDTLLASLNQVFNGKKKLAGHLLPGQQSSAGIFGGPYEYISYADSQGIMIHLFLHKD